MLTNESVVTLDGAGIEKEGFNLHSVGLSLYFLIMRW